MFRNEKMLVARIPVVIEIYNELQLVKNDIAKIKNDMDPPVNKRPNTGDVSRYIKPTKTCIVSSLSSPEKKITIKNEDYLMILKNKRCELEESLRDLGIEFLVE
jgi:hypothetical protein